MDTLPSLKLRGILSYDGGVQHAEGFENRKAQALKAIAPNVETFEMMKKAGLNTEIFSGGGTGTYNIMAIRSDSGVAIRIALRPAPRVALRPCRLLDDSREPVFPGSQ